MANVMNKTLSSSGGRLSGWAKALGNRTRRHLQIAGFHDEAASSGRFSPGGFASPLVQRRSPLPRRLPTITNTRRYASKQPRSSAVPHGIIFVLLCTPACLYAAFANVYGPSEEEMIEKVKEKYGEEIDLEADNFARQKKMIQAAIRNPDSMDDVNRKLLKGGKEDQVAMTRMFKKYVMGDDEEEDEKKKEEEKRY